MGKKSPTFAGFKSFFLPTMMDTPASFFAFFCSTTFVLCSDAVMKYCFCVMMTAIEKIPLLWKNETEAIDVDFSSSSAASSSSSSSSSPSSRFSEPSLVFQFSYADYCLFFCLSVSLSVSLKGFLRDLRNLHLTFTLDYPNYCMTTPREPYVSYNPT